MFRNILYSHNRDLSNELTVLTGICPYQMPVFWLQEVVSNAENSNEDFIPLVEDHIIKYDTIYSLPIKAAIIIDSNVASSGEQMILDIKGCSSRTMIYGKGNTLGCLDYSNIRMADIRGCGITTYVPMTRSSRLPDNGIDDTGIAPDVRISLPLPKN